MLATRPSSQQEGAGAGAAAAATSSQEEKSIPGVRPIRENIDEGAAGFSYSFRGSGCRVNVTQTAGLFSRFVNGLSETSSRGHPAVFSRLEGELRG